MNLPNIGNYIMSNIIKEFIPFLIVWLIWFFSPIAGVIAAVGFLLVVDFISGIWAAKIRKESVNSRKAARTIKKLVFYNLAIITGHVCSMYLTDLIPWVRVISGLIALIEFGSLLENISVITGVKLWTYVRYYVKKSFKLDLEDYLDREKVIDSPFVYRDIVGSKVLIGDTNSINTNIMMEFLSNFNITTTVSRTGKSALEHLESNKYDLIFLDVTLPEIGPGNIAQILRRSDNENKNVPIILMSPANHHKITDKIDPTLFQGYITKPFDLDALYSQILRLIN